MSRTRIKGVRTKSTSPGEGSRSPKSRGRSPGTKSKTLRSRSRNTGARGKSPRVRSKKGSRKKKKENTPASVKPKRAPFVGEEETVPEKRELFKGGGRGRSRPRQPSQPLDFASLQTPTVKNNGRLSGRLNSSAASHNRIFQHYFTDFLRGSSKLTSFVAKLEEQCIIQTGVRYVVRQTRSEGDICVIEFHHPGHSHITSLFHLSIHNISSGGIPGTLGLVHLVSDLARGRERTKWKNHVKLFLDVVNDGTEAGLVSTASHNPDPNPAVQPANDRNAPVLKPSRAESGNPELEALGVTIARVFREYIDSVPKLQIEIP